MTEEEIKANTRKVTFGSIGAFLEMLKEEGPFTKFNEDQTIMIDLMTWIGNDWLRLRELLNFVHDQGIMVGAHHITKMAADYRSSTEFRVNRPGWGADYSYLPQDMGDGLGPTERMDIYRKNHPEVK